MPEQAGWNPPDPPLAEQTAMTHRTAAVVTLAGGAIVSFLPWVTARTGFGTLSVSGTDGDGVITLILGAGITLATLIHLDRQPTRFVRAVIGAAAVVVLAVFATDYGGAVERIEHLDSEYVAASVGPGLYVIALGAATALFGAIRMSSPRS